MNTNKKYLDDRQALVDFKKLTKVSLPGEVSEMQWADLHDTRSRTLKAIEGLVKTADAEKREQTVAEVNAYWCGHEICDKINNEFDAREAAGTKEPLLDRRAVNDADNPYKLENIRGGEFSAQDVSFRSYKGMFPHVQLSNGGFKEGKQGLREFFQSLLSGRVDPRLLENRTHSIGSAVDGGFALPAVQTSFLLDSSLEGELIRPRCRIFPMSGNSLEIGAFKAEDHQNSALFGGFTVTYYGEGATASRQGAKLRSMTLTAHKVGLFTDLTSELVSDQPQFEQWLKNAMIKAIGAVQDYDFIQGNGVAKPLGIINSPSRVAVNRASAGSIVLADLIKMYGRLLPAFQADAIWLVAFDAVPDLMGVVDAGNHLVWSPDSLGGVRGAVPSTLFGKPVIITEKCPSLGNEGDIILVSLSQYGIGLRNDIRVETTNAAQWTSDKVDIRILMRYDGQSLWDKSITPMNGSTNKLSWCVTLK